jgi:peptidoglycan/xylan/chitin deacetylase (PgdA/CDA1 family)
MALAIVIVAAFVSAHMVPFPFLFEAFRPSGSVWRMKAVRGAPPTVYLTFDDGPNAAWTPPLLDALRDAGVRATFFLIDDHVTEQTASIVRRIADEGHAIGLHTGSRGLVLASPRAVAEHVRHASERIERITGRPTCRLFRPHAGWRSLAMYKGLGTAGYRLAGWSWGMWDWNWWQEPSADRIFPRLAKKASAGDIIVIHDGHHKNPQADRRHAAETIRRLAPALQSRGFEFGALCD